MNEVHLRGQVKTKPWTYSGNLYVRLSIRRNGNRPLRSTEDGGGYDYVTVLFPGGVHQGVDVRKGQFVQVHGWIQSRDVHESVADFLQRAQLDVNPPLPASQQTRQVHRSIVEVVADRWQVEGLPGRRGEREKGG